MPLDPQVRQILLARMRAALLGLGVGQPLLLLRSTSWSGDRPVEVFLALHRGDRSRFEVDLERDQAVAGVTAVTGQEMGG